MNYHPTAGHLPPVRLLCHGDLPGGGRQSQPKRSKLHSVSRISYAEQYSRPPEVESSAVAPSLPSTSHVAETDWSISNASPTNGGRPRDDHAFHGGVGTCGVKRLKVAHEHGPNSAPMLASWLFPQLVLVGIGEAFHMPVSLRNTATAMAAMVYAIAFYLSSALIDLVRRVTGWLPDGINSGRLDNVYWLLVVLGVLNFGYFLVCSTFYKYHISNADKERDVNNSAPEICKADK